MVATVVKRHLRNSTPLYEVNFLRLKQFLPNLAFINTADATNPGGDLKLRLDIVERCKYTTTVKLTLLPVGDTRHCHNLSLTVRLYFDVRVAEVLSFQGHRYFQPHYDYPNKKMYQPNEKQQVNRLLADMLGFCYRMQLRFVDCSLP